MAVTIKTTKLKTALGEKTHAYKKELEHKVSVAALTSPHHKSLLSNMKLERRKLSALKDLPRRVRKSEKAQVLRVAKSLQTYGQAAPLIIADDDTILHGHIVAQALPSLGATEAWCVVIDHLTEHERDALHIALNRIGEVGDWDLDLLGPVLVDLKSLDFDLTAIGFTIPELDILIGPTIGTPAAQEAEELSEPTAGPPVSKLGDLWRVGEHRLLCGDSLRSSLRMSNRLSCWSASGPVATAPGPLLVDCRSNGARCFGARTLRTLASALHRVKIRG